MAANRYDAIVIGGGHNGLVAAAYLARSGARVVCEARHKVGGAAATDTPWPDAPEFKVTTYSYVMSLMPVEIIRDLDLARHGYRIHPMGPYYVAFPNGGSLMIGSDDAASDTAAIKRFSARDAAAYPQWKESGSEASPTSWRRCCSRFRARLMTYRTAVEMDARADVKLQHAHCSMVKLFASEMANRVADRSVQIFGGGGYMRENVAERFYRELRVDASGKARRRSSA